MVHVEIQGNYERNFAERMFQYFYRVLDKYGRRIYAIALFTDDSPSFHPDHYHYHFHGTELTYRYNTYKILEQDEQLLLTSDNPFALVILAGLYVIRGKRAADDRYTFKKRLIELLLRKDWSHENIRNLFIFIDGIIQLTQTETIRLIEEIHPLIEKEEFGMALSLEDTSFAKYYKAEGKAEGRREQQLVVAERMLREGFDEVLIARITGLDITEVQEMKKKRVEDVDV